MDVTLDCTSTSSGFGLLLTRAVEGRVIVGHHTGEARFSLFTEVQLKELSIVGAFQPLAPPHPPGPPLDQEANRKAVLEDIAAGRLRVDRLISHRAPAADAAGLLRADGHRAARLARG